MLNSLKACIIIYLLYCKYLLHANGISHQTKLYGADVTIRRNVRLNGLGGENSKTILNSFDSISIGQCISECKSRSDCKAVEYNFLAKYCSLRSDILGFERTPGHLTVTGFYKTVLCNNVICGTGEACDSLRNRCVVKECGHPRYGRHVMGNRYGIKDRLVYKCLEEKEQRTCADDGEWNQVTDGLACGNIRISNRLARSGLYKNRLNMTIYCEFGDDGTGWLVFQRRLDGSVDFYRNWTEYKNGFGNLCGEFWLGLEKMYTILTESTSEFEMRVDLEDWDNEKRYAVYDRFGLSDEDDGYRLLCQGYSGTAKDGINGQTNQIHNGMRFTTFNNDNDVSAGNCAVIYHGAWWYSQCHQSNLNGYYYAQGPTKEFARGIVWYLWRGHYYSMKHVTMKMRENRQCCDE